MCGFPLYLILRGSKWAVMSVDIKDALEMIVRSNPSDRHVNGEVAPGVPVQWLFVGV